MANLLRDCTDALEGYKAALGIVEVPDVAVYNVSAKNTGKLHCIPNLTASQTLNLPTPATGLVAGLEFEFMYSGAAADAQNWILQTGAVANFYKGGVTHHAAATNAAVFSDGVNDQTLTVVTPSGGTKIKLASNGTHWFLTGNVMSASAPTLA